MDTTTDSKLPLRTLQVYHFPNGMTMVFDEDGQQVPQFQSTIEESNASLIAAGYTLESRKDLKDTRFGTCATFIAMKMEPDEDPFYRTLVRLEITASGDVLACVPGWNPHVYVELDKEELPEQIQKFQPGTHRFHANVNINCKNASDLKIVEWEVHSEQDLIDYWAVKCPECNWKGLSKDALCFPTGGDDYDDPICPKCHAKDYSSVTLEDDE